MSQHNDAIVAYLALKTSQRKYGKSPAALSPAELKQVVVMAQRQQLLEARVLQTTDARDVMVPPISLQAALEEIRNRYQSDEEFQHDLALNGLDEASYAAAMEAELKVEAILEKVGSRAEKISEVDIELYYHYHPEKFRRPETRQVSHILITINEAMVDNTRIAAHQRITAIAAKLQKEPQCFAQQAMKYSECPTALQGGVLGDMPRGKLYPVLDECLFRMQVNTLSGVLESPLGFHLLHCVAISPASILNYDQSIVHIRQLLERKRKLSYQQAWLKNL